MSYDVSTGFGRKMTLVFLHAFGVWQREMHALDMKVMALMMLVGRYLNMIGLSSSGPAAVIGPFGLDKGFALLGTVGLAVCKLFPFCSVFEITVFGPIPVSFHGR